MVSFENTSKGSHEVDQMELSMKKLACTEGGSQEMECVLWTGGSWVDESGFEEYKGDRLVERVLKLPSDLTCEVLLNRVRRELGLSMEERLRLTYKRPYVSSDVEFLAIDIVGDQDFEYFMEVVDRLPKPVTLYHVIPNVCTKMEADPEQIHIQVPYEKVGVLIGRGGETIQNLEKRSGALFAIPEDKHSKEMLTVEITGESSQMEMAKEMIEELMNQEEVYEVEILLFSGGAWDRVNLPTEYKGDCILKHVLKLTSNFTWAVLEGQVRTKLSLSLEDTLNLTFPLTLAPPYPQKILPVGLSCNRDLIRYVWFSIDPLTFYVDNVNVG